MKGGSRRSLLVLGLLVVFLVCAYAVVMWEGSSSRADAPAFERVVAQVNCTVPRDARNAQNPLRANPDPG